MASGDNDCCNRKRCSVVTEIILVLIGIAAVVQIFFVPDAIEDYFEEKLTEQFMITNETRQKNNSIWTHWISNDFDDSPIQRFSYYLFNVTNPDGVIHGEIANLTEVGPFVFRRYEYRRDPVFLENNTIVDFTYHYEFEYLADESTPNHSLNDSITIMNPALQTLIFGINYLYASITNDDAVVFLKYFQQINASHAFYHTTIHDVLWNTTDEGMEEYFSETFHQDLNTFSSAINFATNHVTEYTGKGNKKDLGKLIRFFNKTAIEFWGCFNESLYMG